MKHVTSKTFVFMQSCPRWLPLVWFTRPSVVTSQINSWDSGKYPLVWFTRPSVVTSQINSRDPGKYLPELPNFMQYYTWCHAHVIRACCPHVIRSSSPRHLHVVCVSSVHAHMLSAPGHIIRTSSIRHLHCYPWSPGAWTIFYCDRNLLLNGICGRNVEFFHFRIM